MSAEEKALEAYEYRKKGMKYAEIAEKLNVSESTVKSWKTRFWDKQKSKKVATSKREKLQPSMKKLQPKDEKPAETKSRGAPPGNKNAVGNVGGGAPLGNNNAVTHGFFKKIFPSDDETLDILDSILDKNPVDMIWENIVIQYTAIARSQKIMYVKDATDLTKELKKVKTSELSKELEYELQFAWDKQANFLQAQSRAMQTLGSLVKQFNELADPYDERRLNLEAMQLDIDKKRKELGESSKGNELVKRWAEKVKAERRNSNE